MKNQTVVAAATLPNSRLHFKRSMRSISQGIRREDGSQLIELALVLPMLLVILLGAVDFGRAFYIDLEVSSAAEAGALYGLQNPSDTAGMQAAASLDANDLPSLTPVASYGAECYDGTFATAQPAAAPTCTNATVQYVQVATTASYTPILPYPGMPSTFTMHGLARMRATF